MGCCQSTEKVEVKFENVSQKAIEEWNTKREDVLKNVDALTELFCSMETRKERYRLIEENIEVFQEFFYLPSMEGDMFQQIEQMFHSGLARYVKPPKQ